VRGSEQRAVAQRFPHSIQAQHPEGLNQSESVEIEWRLRSSGSGLENGAPQIHPSAHTILERCFTSYSSLRFSIIVQQRTGDAKIGRHSWTARILEDEKTEQIDYDLCITFRARNRLPAAVYIHRVSIAEEQPQQAALIYAYYDGMFRSITVRKLGSRFRRGERLLVCHYESEPRCLLLRNGCNSRSTMRSGERYALNQRRPSCFKDRA